MRFLIFCGVPIRSRNGQKTACRHFTLQKRLNILWKSSLKYVLFLVLKKWSYISSFLIKWNYPQGNAELFLDNIKTFVIQTILDSFLIVVHMSQRNPLIVWVWSYTFQCKGLKHYQFNDLPMMYSVLFVFVLIVMTCHLRDHLGYLCNSVSSSWKDDVNSNSVPFIWILYSDGQYFEPQKIFPGKLFPEVFVGGDHMKLSSISFCPQTHWLVPLLLVNSKCGKQLFTSLKNTELIYNMYHLKQEFCVHTLHWSEWYLWLSFDFKISRIKALIYVSLNCCFICRLCNSIVPCDRGQFFHITFPLSLETRISDVQTMIIFLESLYNIDEDWIPFSLGKYMKILHTTFFSDSRPGNVHCPCKNFIITFFFPDRCTLTWRQFGLWTPLIRCSFFPN